MDLKKAQDHDFLMVTDTYHDLVESLEFDHELGKNSEVTLKILHRIVRFANYFPFRRLDDYHYPAPVSLRDKKWSKVLISLQHEKRALFQLCLYYFAIDRLYLNPAPEKTELKTNPVSPHLHAHLIFGIMTRNGYDPVSQYCMFTIQNLYERVCETLDGFEDFVNQLHIFLRFPTDLSKFKTLEDHYMREYAREWDI